MNANRIYETETMAELCARQGRLGEAITIYRRLTEAVREEPLRARFQRRLATLEASWQPLPRDATPVEIPLPPAPGVSLLVADEQVTVAWSLPPGTDSPTLELLLLQRTPSGIEVNKRTLPLATPTGRLALVAPSLHSAIAAAGTTTSGRFVALARSHPARS